MVRPTQPENVSRQSEIEGNMKQNINEIHKPNLSSCKGNNNLFDEISPKRVPVNQTFGVQIASKNTFGYATARREDERSIGRL